MRPQAAAPALLLVLLGAAALAGCRQLAPYATIPNFINTLPPGATRVAICYNGFETSRAAAQEAAQKECPAGTTAQRADKDYLLQYCPLLQPARATYFCVPDKK
jgi:hypothetical protein